MTFDINEKLKNGVYYSLIGVGILLFLYTRLYRVNEIPPGLHVDEAGMAYDAWSLANYGIDRFLISFPVYFINFGGGQNALYTYLTAILFKLFGFSYALIRVPAFANSVFTLYFGTKLIQRHFGKETWYVPIFVLLIAIMPYFIMASRFGLESNLMLGASTMMLYLLNKAVEQPRNLDFIVAGIMSGVILYAYAISYMILPIFLFFTFIYLFMIKRVNWVHILCFGIPLFIMAMPLMIMLLVNAYDLKSISIGLISIPKLQMFRGSEITTWYFKENVINLIKVTLFNDWLPYNTLPSFLTLYWISIPLVVVGVICISISFLRGIAQRRFDVSMLIYFHAVSIAFVALFIGGNGPNANKVNSIFFPLVFFVLIGMQIIIKQIDRLKSRTGRFFKTLFAVTTMGGYIFLFSQFNHYYFNAYAQEMNYPIYHEMLDVNLFSPTYEDVVDYINGQAEFKDRIIYFENSQFQGYIYYLISALPSPYDVDLTHNNTGNYRLNYFGLPIDYYDPSCVYVVSKTNSSYIKSLEDTHMFKRLEFSKHNVYYGLNPID